MIRRLAKILAAAIALGFGLETSFAPGVTPGAMSEAFAKQGGFGGGGHFGGGHFGGGHFGGGHFGGGQFGGFRGGHFGGMHFGGFRGGHFGGMHFGGFRGGHFGGMHFGGFRGGHFGGMHFGGFRGGHFGGRHFGGGHFARGHFGGREFGGSRFGHANLGGHRFGGAGFGSRAAFVNHRFGGGGFTGVHGFEPHGFNRNAFGSMATWNAWGNNYWGPGWNDWGSGWGYWAGPVFWPFFFGDALTFALWPYASYDPFFVYGPDLLLTSIFWPGPSFRPSYAYNPYYDESPFDIYGNTPYATDYAHYAYHRGRWRHRHYEARSVTEANLDAEANVALTCGSLAPGVINLPIDPIERVIRSTDAQVAMLNDLEAASAQADKILRLSCPTEVPLTPVGRLDAVAKRIQAVIEALQILRPPLTTLYNSLDDEQKDRFAAIGAQSRYRRARIARENTPASSLGLCKRQAETFTLLPVQRIEEAIKPTDQQKAAFDALKSASAKAGAELDASCPADVQETLTGRLDTVAKRLDALTDAVNTVKPALTDFYDTLTDEQKARFNVIGRASPAVAPQGETRSGG